MADLIALVKNHIGHIDFRLYVNELDPLDISRNIRNGPGPAKIENSILAWEGLHTALSELAEKHRKLIVGLPKNWSGKSARSMQSMFAAYEKWMKDTCLAVQETMRCLRKIYYACKEAHGNIVDPAKIQNNRTEKKI